MLTHFWHDSEINQMPQDGEIGKYAVPKGYVNASQMCKANGKFLADYTKLKSTKQYLQALSNDMKILISLESDRYPGLRKRTKHLDSPRNRH